MLNLQQLHEFDDDINYFIKFGEIFDESDRKSLISYFFHKITNKELPDLLLDDFIVGDNYQDYLSNYEYQDYFDAIKNFIASASKIPNLTQICHENSTILKDIIVRFTHSLMMVNRKVNFENSFKEEIMNYNHVKQIKKSISVSKLLHILRKYYNQGKFNFRFFKREILEIEKLQTRIEKKIENKIQIQQLQISKSNLLKKEILDRWKILIEHKKSLLFIEQIDMKRKEFVKTLYDQIEKFMKLKKILRPFTNECGRLWDLSKGLWQKEGFNVLEQYNDLLEKEPDLRKLAEMLGRMHLVEHELEEQEIKETVFSPYYKIFHAKKSELIGIHESNDINNLLPIELTFLDNSVAENIFYKKFVDKKLLSYRFVGYDSTDNQQKNRTDLVPRLNRGPILICVDTSGSMHGTPEHVAKVLCFAILRIALLEKRRCFLISFSTSIQTLELTNIREGFSDLIDFLICSFHGGTDA
ncbi:MAG: hypothetical protein GF364_16450, partial [Candidatus Lokiarchaeota archaeon]|nr:hypothetical protein [Candidatus Lokiarchaeota archaeon]